MTISKKFMRTVLWSLVAALLVGVALGYAATPTRPWVLSHLEGGSYVNEFPNQEACYRAMSAFSAGQRSVRGGVAMLDLNAVDNCDEARH